MDFKALPDAGVIRFKDVSAPSCLVGATGSLTRMDLTVSEGRIAGNDLAADHTMDMGGAMVFPAFVDMHTHLDKAQIGGRTPNPDGTFDGAINAVGADKVGRWDRDDLKPRMSFALRSAYAHGTRAIRTHLDYFGGTEDVGRSWPVFAELRDEWAGRITLQAAALTGSDLAQDQAALDECADLVARHNGILGSCTYPGPDQAKEIAAYFAAAEARGLDLDFHVDETMDPSVNTLKDIAQSAIATGFSGKVTVGHLCSLSVMEDADAQATLDLVAKAGLKVVSLPMCNLYLQDRHGARTPRGRGITLVHEMKARGISVSFSSDNTRDPFYAYGDMDMIEVMREATRIGHLDHSDPDWTHAFLTNPAEACGFDAPSLAPGAPADLVICNARNWTELFARPQSDRIVLRGGSPIDRTLPAYSELDYLMEPA
ncbi:cytosine deaminase [Aliishimia ponticola]|uniref:Cytosine deaminase n=1 Tax=Aliishimia ponticola TaxID=2499833 RepID=A0A4V3XJU2_9RHOB|nr:cytosine deaminase [Aliishimia ponticola]THH34423.1 cytosine deaminase [Aliishimia ponticola]